MIKYIQLVLIVVLTGFVSCEEISSEETTGNWIKYSDFEGYTRSGAVSFVIGEFAYIGLGYDGDEYLKDFWRYDSERNFWEEVAPFPGTGRIAGIGFSLDEKGYVGTGFNADLEIEELDDFWEYNPSSNEWTQKSSFEGGPRYSAVSFSLLGSGYVGTGYDGNYLKDFWRYDAVSDSWTQTVSLFGSKREDAIAFVIEDVAYVGAGVNNGQAVYDFWSFSPESDSWIDLSLNSEEETYDEFIAAMGRQGAVTFVLNNIAYITTGLTSSYSNSIYSYDPSANRWSGDWTAFEGVGRTDAVSFTINSKGFVVTGKSASLRHDDIWGFEPLQEYEEFD